MKQQGAFTLVEMMIAVAVIALLAVIAVPAFIKARQSSQNAKFMNAVRVASGAIEQYAVEKSSYPVDVNRGTVPPGMSAFFDATLDWTLPTPVGGNWDWDQNVFGFVAAVSVVGSATSAEQFREIDRRMDDGNLGTGIFRLTAAGRYSYIIE